MAALTEVPTGVAADIAFGSTLLTDPTAPTAIDVNALTRIECFIDADTNIARDVTGNTITIAALCSSQTLQQPSTKQFETIEMTYFRYLLGAAGDEAWNLFDDSAIPPVTQDLVFCLPGFTGAGTPEVAQAGDLVDVYRGKLVVRAPGPLGREDNQVGMVMFAPQEVYYQVTVA